MLLFEDKYKGSDKSAFIDKVESISYKLGIDPNWLMYVMYNESGLNPASEATYYTFTSCGGGHAGGLIGFTPCTQQALGYTGGWQKFLKLSGTQQLDYAYKLFKPYAGRITNYADLHLITAFPKALGKPLDWVFESNAEGITPQEYAQGNPGFDLNKDGQVTLREFYEWQDKKVRQVVPGNMMNHFIDAQTNDTAEWSYLQTHQRDLVIAGFVTIFLILIVVVIWLISKQ